MNQDENVRNSGLSSRCRRRLMYFLGYLGVAPILAACRPRSSQADLAKMAAAVDAGESCSEIPDETEGPFPGDGTGRTGRLNVLTLPGVVRRDIRSSFAADAGNGAAFRGTASGVPLTLKLKLLRASTACPATPQPLAGYAVYLWHCTRDGGYSLYSDGHTNENYLRGVQVADKQGEVEFLTVFPGCYPGRWPHVHFEVFPDQDRATNGRNDVKTSQIALPLAACQQVYGVVGYENSVATLRGMTLEDDNIFGDDSAVLQLATVSGDLGQGLQAVLQVAV